jgi:hypothetical protein
MQQFVNTHYCKTFPHTLGYYLNTEKFDDQAKNCLADFDLCVNPVFAVVLDRLRGWWQLAATRIAGSKSVSINADFRRSGGRDHQCPNHGDLG